MSGAEGQRMALKVAPVRATQTGRWVGEDGGLSLQNAQQVFRRNFQTGAPGPASSGTEGSKLILQRKSRHEGPSNDAPIPCLNLLLLLLNCIESCNFSVFDSGMFPYQYTGFFQNDQTHLESSDRVYV